MCFTVGQKSPGLLTADLQEETIVLMMPRFQHFHGYKMLAGGCDGSSSSSLPEPLPRASITRWKAPPPSATHSPAADVTPLSLPPGWVSCMWTVRLWTLRGEEGEDKQRPREKPCEDGDQQGGHVEMAAERPPQAKEHQGLPANPRSRMRPGSLYPYRLHMEHGPADTLSLDFQLQNRDRINFCRFKPSRLRSWLRQPMETGRPSHYSLQRKSRHTGVNDIRELAALGFDGRSTLVSTPVALQLSP
ncbi:uncharacterized protein LOC119527841 isoform X2 [Choloepus didactylus]|uniref:uncharacterized protein LOC119527841 isoform X2 n=1 Tax=Choloepus didactylus TaxID=27675 RepID=UPI0018A02165|nr:uncharacterized protein LOC119527841 isoform X2 [Choloepus didactylus]